MMNKYVIFYIILLILIALSCSKEKQYDEIPDSHKLLTSHKITDQETAKRIAEIVFLTHYGKSIYDKKPFKVYLEMKKDTVWHIYGSMPDELGLGGVPYIAIRSINGEILQLSHGK